jgi:hypothetical protein
VKEGSLSYEYCQTLQEALEEYESNFHFSSINDGVQWKLGKPACVSFKMQMVKEEGANRYPRVDSTSSTPTEFDAVRGKQIKAVQYGELMFEHDTSF